MRCCSPSSAMRWCTGSWQPGAHILPEVIVLQLPDQEVPQRGRQHCAHHVLGVPACGAAVFALAGSAGCAAHVHALPQPVRTTLPLLLLQQQLMKPLPPVIQQASRR